MSDDFAMITVKITGQEKLISDIRKASADVQDAARKVLNEQAEIIRDDAKSRVAVESGTLQKSIKASKTRKTLNASVSAGGGDAYYAPFVEFGTKNADAQPFLYPAARAHEEETEKKLVEAMTKTLKEAVEG
ncbi:MAG: HK97-gp10 family putative phage morphogenesis protein [Synergistaceae bacterium]